LEGISKLSKFLVVGGAGNVGEIVIKYLIKQSDVEEVICGDINLEKAKTLAKTLGDDRIKVEWVDASNIDSLCWAMRNVDVVIAALPPPTELLLNTIEAAFESGCHYVDFGSTFTVLFHLFNISSILRNTGLTALTCIGAAPGLTDIFAKFASEKLDKIERIHIRDGAITIGKGVFSTYSPIVFIEECITKGWIYENGELKRVMPLTGKEIYNFPNPIGELPVYYVSHEEPITIPKGLDKEVGFVDFKLAMTNDTITVLKALENFGLFNVKPIEIKGVKISPIEFFLKTIKSPSEVAGRIKGHECLVAEVIGEKGRKKVERRVFTYMTHEEAYKRFKSTATAYLSGVSGAIAALMIAREEIAHRGTVVPAQLDAEKMLKELKKVGIEVKEEVRELE